MDWSAFLGSFTPHIGPSPADPSLWYGLAYHGSGVATAVWAGKMLAQEIAGIPSQMSALFRQPPRSFPLPPGYGFTTCGWGISGGS
jgi:glycine/D-amino acid oxidase-like deaminating enzyme